MNKIRVLALMSMAFVAAVHGNNLAAKLEAVDVTRAQAEVGIGVLHLNTGKSWYLQGSRPFPMQSVVKLPVAIATLKRVDDKKLSLDQTVTVTPADFAPAWSPLRDELKGKSGDFTVRELLERSVSESDNTAVDVLIKLNGGTNAVDALLKQLGIRGVRVDRTEAELQTRAMGLDGGQPSLAEPEQYRKAISAIPEDKRRDALMTYLLDPRDTATPEGMVHLLSLLHQRKLLSDDSTNVLLKIMTQTPHGANRIKAGLPSGWTIAHKTGTGGDILGTNTATNDVGIACSPAGECYAIAVFTAGSKADIAERESLMRDVAAAATGAPTAKSTRPAENSSADKR